MDREKLMLTESETSEEERILAEEIDELERAVLKAMRKCWTLIFTKFYSFSFFFYSQEM